MLRPMASHVPRCWRLAHEAQMLVVGSRGRGGLKVMLLGSVSQAISHHAAGPVCAVHSPADDR